MKHLLSAGLLIALCSCSVESRLKGYRPKNIGSYEWSTQTIYYETDIYKVTLYDKRGKVKDSVLFYIDIEKEKPKRFDKNGNIIINSKRFKSLLIPKWSKPPLVRQI